MKAVINSIKRFWRGGDGKYTVISDYSRFRPGIHVEHIIGIRAAKRFSRRWVRNHPFSESRVYEGHID